MTIGTCADCGESGMSLKYEDPRTPPLDEGECLCADCFIGASIEDIEDRAQQLVCAIEQAKVDLPDEDFKNYISGIIESVKLDMESYT